MEPDVISTAQGEGQDRRAEYTLLTAMSCSLLGTAVSVVLMPLIAVGEFGAGPLQLGLLTAASVIPAVLLRVPAGRLADRLRHRITILAAIDLARGLMLLGFVGLWAAGWGSLLLLYLLVVMVGAGSVAHSSLMPSVVPSVSPGAGAGRMFGRLGSAESLADSTGPGLASVLVVLMATPLALLVDATTYVVSAALKLTIRRRDEGNPANVGATSTARDDQTMVPDLPRLPMLALLSASNGVWAALLLLFLTRTLQLPTFAFGVVLTCGAVGGVLGGVLAGRLFERLGTSGTLRLGGALMGLGSAIIPFSLLGGGLVLPALGDLIGGAGAVTLMAGMMAHIHRVAPQAIGQCAAKVMLTVEVGHVVGALTGGLLGTVVGLDYVLIAASAAAGLAAAAWWASGGTTATSAGVVK